jgi:hypothetical protein
LLVKDAIAAGGGARYFMDRGDDGEEDSEKLTWDNPPVLTATREPPMSRTAAVQKENTGLRESVRVLVSRVAELEQQVSAQAIELNRLKEEKSQLLSTNRAVSTDSGVVGVTAPAAITITRDSSGGGGGGIIAKGVASNTTSAVRDTTSVVAEEVAVDQISEVSPSSSVAGVTARVGGAAVIVSLATHSTELRDSTAVVHSTTPTHHHQSTHSAAAAAASTQQQTVTPHGTLSGDEEDVSWD